MYEQEKVCASAFDKTIIDTNSGGNFPGKIFAPFVQQFRCSLVVRASPLLLLNFKFTLGDTNTNLRVNFPGKVCD